MSPLYYDGVGERDGWEGWWWHEYTSEDPRMGLHEWETPEGGGRGGISPFSLLVNAFALQWHLGSTFL